MFFRGYIKISSVIVLGFLGSSTLDTQCHPKLDQVNPFYLFLHRDSTSVCVVFLPGTAVDQL